MQRALYTELYQRVLYSPDIEPVRDALRRGANPNYPKGRSRYYTTALHAAVSEARELNVEKINTLVIEGRCDVDILDNQGRTALLWASGYSSMFPVVQELLTLDANPNIVSNYGITALCEAATYSSAEIVRELLKYGADVNPPIHRDAVRQSPLSCATIRNDPTVAIILLDHGARIDALTSDGKTVLGEAVRFRSVDTVDMLLSRNADPNAVDGRTKTPLHICAENHTENATIARMLLEAGADPNARGRLGATPLHSAVRYGNMVMVEFLVRNKADLWAKNQDGETALQVAASRPDFEPIAAYLREREHEERLLAVMMSSHRRLGGHSRQVPMDVWRRIVAI